MARHKTTWAYGAEIDGKHFNLEIYQFPRNHNKAVTVRRWKRVLKSKARQAQRKMLNAIGNLVDIEDCEC